VAEILSKALELGTSLIVHRFILLAMRITGRARHHFERAPRVGLAADICRDLLLSVGSLLFVLAARVSLLIEGMARM